MLEIIIGKSDKDWIIVGNFFYILIFAFVLLLIEVCKHHEVRQCNLLSMCIARGPTTSRLKCVFHHQVSILEHHKKYVMLLLNIESIVCMTAVDCLEEIVSCLKSLSSLLLNKFYSCFFLVYEKKYFSNVMKRRAYCNWGKVAIFTSKKVMLNAETIGRIFCYQIEWREELQIRQGC